MPFISMIVEDCKAVWEYKEGLETKIIPMECYLIKQPDNKLLFIILWPIFYIFEWKFSNPLFRWITKKGMAKAGYDLQFENVNRLELLRLLLKVV